MSLTRCDKCDNIIDTDENPESCVEHPKYNFLCDWCREELEVE